MNGKSIGPMALAAVIAAICISSCLKENKKAVTPEAEEIPLSDVDIEKKYLSEGFISPDLYRIVIVMTKDQSSTVPDMVLFKARKRAQVSLERCMDASGTTADRNIRAEILSLIDQNGSIEKKDIEQSRYSVYYFDIVRKNLKNHLKNISAAR